MQEAKFILKDKKKESSLIYLYYNLTSPRFKYSTGQKVNPAYWDYNEHRAKIKGLPEETSAHNKRVNREIQKHEDFLNKTIRAYLDNEKSFTNTDLHNDFENRFKIAPKTTHRSNDSDLFVLLDGFVEDMQEGRRLTKKGQKIAPRTIDAYNVLKTHLLAFRKVIDINDIDINFYNDFVRYFHRHNKSTNTVGGNIKNLKAFLKAMHKSGKSTNAIYLDDSFVKLREQTDDIYLTDAECDQLWELELPDFESKARYEFLFTCYTGLRISDSFKFNPAKHIVDGIIKITQSKGGNIVYIPLHPKVKWIIENYPDAIYKPHLDQNLNRIIKDVCKKAGFNKPFCYTITKGGLKKEETFATWEMVTVHTGRRSFATNLWKAGVDIYAISKMLGHHSIETTMRYIKVTKEEVARRAAEHPWFK